nr:DUF2793 domain-containing protein [Cereibacter sphaeroides]
MSDTTTHLGLPYLLAAQAQKHVTHNEALRLLDGMVQLSVLDRTRTTPPASPADGNRHLVASGATGLWTGWDLNIAFWVERDRCQPRSSRVWQSITRASVAQPSRPAQTRQRSVDHRSLGAWATEGTASILGRIPIWRFRTCQPLIWKMRWTVFLLKPSSQATVR